METKIKKELSQDEQIDSAIERLQKALKDKAKAGKIEIQAKVSAQKAHNEWLSAMSYLNSVNKDIM